MGRTLTPSSTAEAFKLELEHGTRWQGANIGGGPVSGIDSLNVGILPEPYWAAATEAVYAVYHYETPIAWKVEAGTWYVPDHKYSTTTSTFRNKIVRALESINATVKWI